MTPIDSYMQLRAPNADQPLLGLTILLVEDSRFAAEGFRLLALRSGARLRRADSLQHARRHLRVYRPTVVMVDLGLPDGSGAQLITELSQARPRIDIILGVSADPAADATARAAGADGFLEKPIASLAGFQAEVLRHLPAERQPAGPRPLPRGMVEPDRLALRDDLAHAAEVLKGDAGGEELDYVTQFLAGVARSAGDEPLSEAVGRLAAARADGRVTGADVSELSDIVDSRLSPLAPMS
ncbi:response regulator [Pseudoroseicyclus tamaricis]|uniref:Response regulator n=1 Tax=Pseudoroseicyclus tamaricis TaxID=2705421 RepID=A0A6B2JWA7_9RHOB|nr:response regulator [Pseudoroseicyclus tamaricis]NDV02195.1 response regulator [Pseudoroseicyclus tamaricis]